MCEQHAPACLAVGACAGAGSTITHRSPVRYHWHSLGRKQPEDLTEEEIRIQFLKREFFRLFTDEDKQPEDRRKYKITAIICSDDAENPQECTEEVGDNFSMTDITVTFEE